MKKPKSQIAEVLFELIRKRKVSFHNFQMQDFRKRISELKLIHNLHLKRELVQDVTKYGNHYTYAVHSLPEKQREKAIKIYDKINLQSSK